MTPIGSMTSSGGWPGLEYQAQVSSWGVGLKSCQRMTGLSTLRILQLLYWWAHLTWPLVFIGVTAGQEHYCLFSLSSQLQYIESKLTGRQFLAQFQHGTVYLEIEVCGVFINRVLFSSSGEQQRGLTRPYIILESSGFSLPTIIELFSFC